MKKQLKITIIATLPISALLPNHQRYRSEILNSWKKVVSKFDVAIFHVLREIGRQKALLSGWSRLGRFIVLNDSAALITPVHKKGSKNIVSNYRPISILSDFSKIFESQLYTRIQSFFHSNLLLPHKQFGYIKKKSTDLPVFNLMSKVFSAIDEKKFCSCVFP